MEEATRRPGHRCLAACGGAQCRWSRRRRAGRVHCSL